MTYDEVPHSTASEPTMTLRSITIAFVSLACLQSANAQINAPYDRPAGFGGQFGTVGGGFPVTPLIYPGFGYGGYNPYFYQRSWGGSFGNNSFYDTPIVMAPVAAVAALHPAHLSSFLASQRIAQTATFVKLDTVLTVELPFVGDAWLNGVRQPKPASTHELVGPAMQPGQSKKFAVRATWTRNGITYEYERTIEMQTGDHKGIVVFNGTPLNSK